jgi:long-chain acyl-CoA synthetase
MPLPSSVHSLVDLLERAQQAYPDNCALRDRTDDGYIAWSYRAYAAHVHRLAHHLAAAAPAATVIGILMPNCRWWGATLLATLSCDAVAVPLDVHLHVDELTAIVQHARMTVLVHADSMAATAAAVQQRCACLATLLAIDIAGSSPAVTQLLGAYPATPRPYAHVRCDTAVIIYTSGTTGQPKGVPLSHANLLIDVYDLLDMLAITHGEHFVSILPLNHVYEILGGFIAPLALGASITYAATLRPDVIMQTIRDAQMTVMMVVPAFLRVFMERIQQRGRAGRGPWFDRLLRLCRAAHLLRVPLGRWLFRRVRTTISPAMKCFICGGAPVDPALLKDYAALGLTVLQGYGLTETAPVVALSTFARNRLGAVGRPVASVEVKVVPYAGAAPHTGELWVRGSIVFRGYYRDPDTTAPAFHNDWFRTGDVARLDRAGYLHICGRIKNVIVTEGGKNIYPEDIECLLLRSHYIKDAAVIGLPAAGKGEEPVVAVVPSDSCLARHAAGTPQAVRAHVLALTIGLADFKRPKKVFVLEHLPKTASLKVKRHELRARLAKTMPAP